MSVEMRPRSNDAGPVPAAIAAAYDPERFRADGHRLIDQLGAYLARAERRDDAPVLPWVDPAANLARWPATFPAGGGADLNAVLGRIVDESIRLHHPRYLGHQVPPPLPAAALADLVAALLNNGMAVYEMGPAAVPIELACLRWMAAQLGYPDEAGGVMTSGGSVGNLTALLVARQARAGFDAWTLGAHGGPPLAVLCSTQAHYSVSRALRIMGWGEGGAVPVPVDDRFRMRADALDEAAAGAAGAGRRVIAVIASAGATATGSYDPLGEIADVCAARGLWLHVDGAHGASAALSPTHRHLVRGIERADSVVWDAHKMMMMPALVTAVLFRDNRRSYEAFAQEASYLFTAAPDEEWWNLGTRTLECTKRMLAVKLYATLQVHGSDLLATVIDRLFALGRALAARIDAAPDFELAVQPEANIVCFRWRPTGVPINELDQVQSLVRRRAIEQGRYYFLQTRIHGDLWLRSALMNPLTEDRDLDGLIDHIRQIGDQIVDEPTHG
jgi:L-2,4-diaminobutyrate decarboxylase